MTVMKTFYSEKEVHVLCGVLAPILLEKYFIHIHPPCFDELEQSGVFFWNFRNRSALTVSSRNFGPTISAPHCLFEDAKGSHCPILAYSVH
jgi:hypothetical protein